MDVWSLVFDDENVSARKRKQRDKMPLDEEAVGPERDVEREWVRNWPPDVIDQNKPKHDDSEYERALCERKSI